MRQYYDIVDEMEPRKQYTLQYYESTSDGDHFLIMRKIVDN